MRSDLRRVHIELNFIDGLLESIRQKYEVLLGLDEVRYSSGFSYAQDFIEKSTTGSQSTDTMHNTSRPDSRGSNNGQKGDNDNNIERD